MDESDGQVHPNNRNLLDDFMTYGGAARGEQRSRKEKSDLCSEDNRESCEAIEFRDDGEEEEDAEEDDAEEDDAEAEESGGDARTDAAESDEDASDAEEAPGGRCETSNLLFCPLCKKL